MKTLNIAIDGPAGAGKSTISKAIAKEAGFTYIDTGAMYRALAYYVLTHGGDTKSAQSVEEFLDEINIDLQEKDGNLSVFLNGEDVASYIRTPEVSVGASDVGTIPAVREKLLGLQRDIAARRDVVMDGRDIGSHVLPNADVKIFLTADVAIRARRRLAELVQKGGKDTYDEVLQDMKYRDKNDSERKIAPLVRTEDAVVVDTTHLTLGGSVMAVKKAINKKLGKKLFCEYSDDRLSIRVKKPEDNSEKIANIELKDGFYGKMLCDMSDDDVNAVCASLKENGKRISLYTVNMPPAEHEKYERAVENAQKLGIEYLKLCLSPLAAGYKDEDLKFLINLNAGKTKKLLFEMRAKYTHFTLETYKKFRCSHTGLVFNPMEYAEAGILPHTDVLSDGDIAKDVHFLRVNDFGDSAPARLGCGKAEIQKCVNVLKNRSDVYFSFREYMDGYSAAELISDYGKLL